MGDHRADAEEGEHQAVLRRRVAEAAGGEEGERGLHRDEGDGEHEGHEVGAAQGGVAQPEDRADRVAQARLQRRAAGFGGEGLLEAPLDPDEVHHA